jgi:hypothetical protein
MFLIGDQVTYKNNPCIVVDVNDDTHTGDPVYNLIWSDRYNRHAFMASLTKRLLKPVKNMWASHEDLKFIDCLLD